MKPALTVLTDPIPVGRFRLKETLKRMGRPLKSLVKQRPEWLRRFPYRGHFAVTRSLVEGLRKIGASANYNPTRVSEIGEAVIVLGGIDTLKQADHLEASRSHSETSCRAEHTCFSVRARGCHRCSRGGLLCHAR